MSVILYSTHCPKCDVLSTKLNEKNIAFIEVTDEDIMRDKGFVNMPMLEVDGEIMDFSSAIKWANEN